MTKNICKICNKVYNTNSTTLEQEIIADEDFCKVCWKRMFEEIGAVAD